MAEKAEKVTVCICGGGNGAHVLAGLAAAHARTETRVLTLYENEAEVWTEKMKGGDFIVSRRNPDGTTEEIKAKPSLVTNDAREAVPGADVIIICVPAFAHRQYFETIAPHVKANTSIIGLPGQPGFELQCFNILKDTAASCAILNYESLPWACRLVEFGRKVVIQGTKDALLGSKVCGRSHPREDPAHLLQCILGQHPVLSWANSYLEVTLMNKAFVHPSLLYASWRDWDGQPLREKPIFYQGLSELAASLVASISTEIVTTARAISKARPDVMLNNVEHFESWFIRNYRHMIQDPSSLYTAMKTNSAYDGLVHPMKESSPGEWVPNFQHRYLLEDVPFGLVVTKGVAQIMGLSTPDTDRVLTWAQGRLGKEFMVGSELKGKDVKDTRAPQAFGFNTLDELLRVA